APAARRAGDADGAEDGSASAGRGRPTATAAIAPSSEITADTTIAGRYPEVKLATEPKCPWAANTAVTTAMPNAAPNRCIVLLTPEARPTSAGGAAPSGAARPVRNAPDPPQAAAMRRVAQPPPTPRPGAPPRGAPHAPP